MSTRIIYIAKREKKKDATVEICNADYILFLRFKFGEFQSDRIRKSFFNRNMISFERLVSKIAANQILQNLN